VDFHLRPSFAQFAPARQKPLDQLLSAGLDRGWLAVIEDRRLLPFQRDTTEPSDQRFPAYSFDRGFKAGASAVTRFDGGPVFAGHLRHGRFVLCW
jgi:hypothetical protein